MTKKILLSLIAISMTLGCAKNRDRENQRPDVTYDDRDKLTWIRPNDDGTRSTWLSKVTVINTSDAPAGTLFIGYQGDVQAGYFDFTENHLQFRSVEGIQEGSESPNIKNNVLMNWNIRHVDYALDESDGQTTNQEIESDFKVWHQKRKFEFQWNEIKEVANSNQMFPISSFSFFQCWSPVNIRRVEDTMKIEDDHIGWNIEVVYQRLPACANAAQWNQGDFNFTATYKYSFKKMTPSDYTPKVYSNEQDPARYKYGHFQTTRTIKHPKDGRRHTVFMENKWAEKTQKFYFVKGFPEKYKWIWDHTKPQSVFGQTNALLASMKSKLRFEIYDYNEGGVEREFGDLRYSFINFIEELEAGGTPLGYGPSDTNPFTGEIIAANSMVWTGYLDYYMGLVQTVVETTKPNPDGSENLSSLFREINRSLEAQSGQSVTADSLVKNWDHTKGVGKLFKQMAQQTRYAHPFWNSYTMDTGGQFVVPMLLDRYQDGTVSLPNGSVGPITEHASFFSQVVDMPADKVPYNMETRLNGGILEAKVVDPFALNLDWMKRILDDANGKAEARGVRSAFEALNKIQKIMNSNYTGPEGFEHVTKGFVDKTLKNIEANMQGHCIMDMDEFGGGLAGFLKSSQIDISDEATRQDIINTVLYRVSIHEFGHNLNLRHNFYGSVDQANFKIGGETDEIGDFAGSNGLKRFKIVKENNDYKYVEVAGDRKQISSSVMDYLRLEDEIETPWVWEEYDVAAIRDSYEPKGFDDKGHLYLFCTDEHTATSAICNRHDLGTTPSQILMSQIRSYDERYEMRNKRYGRAYWNTSGYASQMLGTMWSMKEFLPFWRAALSEDFVLNKLGEMGVTNLNDQSVYLEEINREMRNVMKLSMAFYDGVIQQSRGQRDFRSEYDETTGALKQLGIVADKLYATLFLAGDDGFFYNPNRVRYHESYLTYSGEPGLARFADQIWVNFVTDRQVAMDPWFINFTRVLYAKNAKNFNNRGASSLINALKIVRVDSAEDLLNEYGIVMEKAEPMKKVRLGQSSGGFNTGDEVVVATVDGKYYMTSVAEGKYAFVLFSNAEEIIKGNGDDEDSITQFKMDLRELLWLYEIAEAGALQ